MGFLYYWVFYLNLFVFLVFQTSSFITLFIMLLQSLPVLLNTFYAFLFQSWCCYCHCLSFSQRVSEHIETGEVSSKENITKPNTDYFWQTICDMCKCGRHNGLMVSALTRFGSPRGHCVQHFTLTVPLSTQNRSTVELILLFWGITVSFMV